MRTVLRAGDKGPRVVALQEALQRAGFALARYGADGDLGGETLDACELFAGDDPVDNTPDDTIPLALEDAILAAQPAVVAVPKGGSLVELAPGFIDARRHYDGTSYPNRNAWKAIDTLCWHQMAVDGGKGWERWKRLAIHIVVPRKGPTALTNSLDRRVPHGHGWNSRSVGFEVEGHYAGVVSRPETHWKPQGATGSRVNPQYLTEPAVLGAIAAAEWSIAEVAKNGGEIKYCGAHRQSYGAKTSDPGELVWKRIVLPLMQKYGLKTAPVLKHHKYPGRPIPEAWDPSQTGVKY